MLQRQAGTVQKLPQWAPSNCTLRRFDSEPLPVVYHTNFLISQQLFPLHHHPTRPLQHTTPPSTNKTPDQPTQWIFLRPTSICSTRRTRMSFAPSLPTRARGRGFKDVCYTSRLFPTEPNTASCLLLTKSNLPYLPPPTYHTPIPRFPFSHSRSHVTHTFPAHLSSPPLLLSFQPYHQPTNQLLRQPTYHPFTLLTRTDQN